MDHSSLKLLLLSPSQYTVLGIKGRLSVQWAFDLSSSFWPPKTMLPHPATAAALQCKGWVSMARVEACNFFK